MRTWALIGAALGLAGLVGCQAGVTGGLGRIADRATGGVLGGQTLATAQAREGGARGGRALAADGLEQRTLSVGGLERSYYLYRPPGAGGSAPLVLAFHGGGQNPARFAAGVGLQEMADRYGFVMAVPVGVQESWNTGSLSPQGYAEEAGIDDLSFVRAVIDDVAASGAADPGRVYAMGVSRGGMMSYYAACNLPGQFRAIAVVAGTLASGTCPDAAGVSLLHIHGTADERVPWEGGAGQFTAQGQTWPSAEAGVMTFAAAAQCSGSWRAEPVTADTTCEVASCPGSGEVEYCLVQGGGHTWPGVATTRRQQRQGAASSSLFDATDHIAAFFEAH